MTDPSEDDIEARVGESEEWEEAYQRTRRSIRKRKARLEFYDWVGENRRILDLGSGDGLDLRIFAELGDRRVVGFDASHALLSKAEGERVVGDTHVLPFRAESFDVVFANSVLHHFDFPRMVGEVHRILKESAFFCFMEPRPGLGRSLLDRLTDSDALGAIVPYFRYRKIGLHEEWDVHYRWLDNFGKVPGLLREAGFALDRQRKTVVGVLAQWKKR